MKRKNSVKIVALLAVAILLFSGCTIRGGGRLLDADQIRCQSTFGINAVIREVEPDGDFAVECCFPEYEACGHFTYYDKQARLKVLGVVDGGIAFDIDECGIGAVATVWGEYEDHCGVTGPACIMLYDSQFNGACRNSYDPEGHWWEEFKPDRVGIKLMRPCQDEYFNYAPLARGNIKICAPEIPFFD